MLFAVEALYLVLLAAFVRALQPLAVKGTKLYDADGKQFFIKGESEHTVQQQKPAKLGTYC